MEEYPSSAETTFRFTLAASIRRCQHNDCCDARLNKNGGVLIFTTHYPELLDEFDRNDCINITRNTEGISVQNLTDILKRNDLKKSDAYMSDYLGGTAPLYDSYIALKRYIAKAIEGGGAE